MQYNNNNLNLFYTKRGKIYLIRPLLIFNRFQILRVCIFFRLPIYFDFTNKLINLRRNRLRYQIIPLFKVFFNPKINTALNRFISIINCENDYFTNHLKNIEKFFKLKKLNAKNLKKIYIREWFVFLPKALQRKFYKQVLTSRFKSLTFEEIELLLKINISLFK